MKQFIVTTLIALASFVAAAQTSPGTTPPASTIPTPQPQTSPSQSSDIGAAGNQMPAGDKNTKTLKGCIESSGAQFTLEEKSGRQVALTGSQDFASHVGHTVTVHGSYISGSDPSSVTPSSTNSGMGTGEQFMVTKLNMVSEKCMAPKSKGKDTKKDPNNDPNGKPSPYRY